MKLSQSRGFLRIDSEILSDGGHYLQSPRYVGYLSGRGGVLFFDKRGTEDPTEFLRAVGVARAVYLRRYAESPSSARVRDNDPGRFPVH